VCDGRRALGEDWSQAFRSQGPWWRERERERALERREERDKTAFFFLRCPPLLYTHSSLKTRDLRLVPAIRKTIMGMRVDEINGARG
jgi:hypothetical protein